MYILYKEVIEKLIKLPNYNYVKVVYFYSYVPYVSYIGSLDSRLVFKLVDKEFAITSHDIVKVLLKLNSKAATDYLTALECVFVLEPCNSSSSCSALSDIKVINEELVFFTR